MEAGWIEYIRKMLDIYENIEKSGGELTDEQLNDLENLIDSALAAIQFVREQREEGRQAAAYQGKEVRTEI